MILTNKNIIITGASRGIGKAISELFIKKGAKVFAIDIDKNSLNLAKKELNTENYIPYLCNITKEDEIKKTIDDILLNFKYIDALVNNAGIIKDNFIVRMKKIDFEAVINVNLTGTFLISKEVSKTFRKQRFGNIVNISSIVGIDGNSGQCNYSASKAAILGLTKSLSKELTLRGEDIRVNAIAPGFIKTNMTEDLNDSLKDKVISQCLVKRFGTPEDIAKLALFLISEDSSYITGQIIRVDGGLNL